MYKVTTRETPFSKISSVHSFDSRSIAVEYAQIARSATTQRQVVIVDTARKVSVAY